MPTNKLTLTPDQRRAIDHDGDAALLAGAGSGKTFVLIEKTCRLVREKQVPLDRILIVVFNDKAAAEIRDRLGQRLGIPQTSIPEGTIGTVHAFAASMLRRHGTAVGVAPDFRVLDESLAHLDRLRTVRETLLTLAEEHQPQVLEAIDLFGFHGTVKLSIDLLQLSHRQPIVHEYAQVVNLLRQAFEARKRARNLLDFNDLESLFVKLLDIDEERQRLQAAFQWVIVDEFQDINPVQWKILSRIVCPGSNHLVIVGDPRQSIYRFRGADPSLFQAVQREITSRGGAAIFLNENFRSSQAVIHHANQVGERLFQSDFPPLIGTRSEEGALESLRFDGGEDADTRRLREAQAVLGKIKDLISEEASGITLLFRHRKAILTYEKILREAGIPYQTQSGESLLERPEVISVIVFLEHLLVRDKPDNDPSKRISQAALACSPLRDLGTDLPTDPVFLLEALFEACPSRFPLPWHRKNLQFLKKLLEGLMYMGESTLPAIVSALRVLREEEARIPCAPPMTEGSSSGAIRMMTVHESKGLEFPVVILCDLGSAGRPPLRRFLYDAGDGTVIFRQKDNEARGLKETPGKSARFEELEEEEKEAEAQESKRLLYVALTRARERLILPLPRETKESKRRDAWISWLKETPKKS